MRINALPYYITVFLLLFSGWVASSSARDVGPRWVETARWTGSGTVYTEPFYIVGGRWRLKFYPVGRAPFDIVVCDAAATPVGEAAVADKPLPGWRTFRDDHGYRILRILGPRVRWTLSVEQHMTVHEQWALNRQQKAHVPVYRQIGVWSGDGSGEPLRFRVPVREAPWRVVIQNEESGRLDVVLRDESGSAVVEAELQRAGAVESWGFAAGEYSLEVGAADTAWTVRLYAAGLSQ